MVGTGLNNGAATGRYGRNLRVGGLRAFGARASAIAMASSSIALGHDASKFGGVLSVQEVLQ